MTVELHADIETTPGSPDVADGWRGLIDFGEVWTEGDAALWRDEWGDLPLGRPLTYGCEARRDEAAGTRRVRLRLLALDESRSIMAPGRAFTLPDGAHERALGRLV